MTIDRRRPERETHVIVCGLGGVALRAVEQLRSLDLPVTVVEEAATAAEAAAMAGLEVEHLARPADAHTLATAGLANARAVICSDRSDLRTLDVALLVRDLRPDLPVVLDLDNPAVGRAVEASTGVGSVVDVAGLFAPSAISTLVGEATHPLPIAGARFVVREVVAPRTDSLRALYGVLAPIGVVRDGGVLVSPGRDEVVRAGEHLTLLGTEEEFAAAGMRSGRADDAPRRPGFLHRAGHRVMNTLHAIADATDRAARVTLVITLVTFALCALVLRLFYVTEEGGQMETLQAVYFTFETAATVGFGDFSFARQGAWMQAFGIFLIVAGTTLVSTLFAIVTNALVSRRIDQTLGRGKLRGMEDHVVVVGLGDVGMRIVAGLVARGRDVAAIERDGDGPFVNEARGLGVPVVVGDATSAATHENANLAAAAAVAIVTSDDLTNLETGLAVRDGLGGRWGDVPVVVRVVDRALGTRLERNFGFRHVWSTAAIAAPWFAGAAAGFGVISTFYVGNEPFLVARLGVSPGGGLDGMRMHELPPRARVVAIARGAAGVLEHPPRRDDVLAGGDAAYLVGPYDALLQTVRRDRDRGRAPRPT